MFRRSPSVPPPAPAATPPEHLRITAARSVLSHGHATGPAEQVLDRVADAVRSAEAELRRLDRVIRSLEPERVAGELKTALRRRASPMVDDTPVIIALRRRHEAVHRVANSREALAADIERTLTDVETLVTDVVAGATRGELERQLRTVNDEAEALSLAHAEVERIDDQTRDRGER